MKAVVTEIQSGAVGHGPFDLSITVRSSGPLEISDQALNEFFASIGKGGEVTVTITDAVPVQGFRSRLARLAHEDALDALAAERGGIGFQAMQDREAARRK